MVQPIRMVGMILAGLAALVLALVAIGVYGTVSYRIASIRHEIGIHLALGADTVQVVRAVVAPLAERLLPQIRRLVPRGARVLVAASGGPDSPCSSCRS